MRRRKRRGGQGGPVVPPARPGLTVRDQAGVGCAVAFAAATACELMQLRAPLPVEFLYGEARGLPPREVR